MQEHNYLKKAISINIANLTKCIADQETFNSTLSSHINIIHTRLSHLTLQFSQARMSQNNCDDNDYVELTCPEFDPALDEPVEAASHATQNKEETGNTGGFTNQNSTRPKSQPKSIPTNKPESTDIPPDLPPLEDATPEEDPDDDWSPEYDSWPETTLRSNHLEAIPEIQEDSKEEDWENRQFQDSEADYVANNVTRRDYSQAFLKQPVTFLQGHEENTSPTIQYSIPDTDYDPSPRCTPLPANRHLHTNARYLPPTPSGADIHAWETGLYGRGRAWRIEIHKNRLFGEKTRSKEARIVRKRWKNLRA